MRLTDALRQAAEPLWESQLRHPFVQGLADGSLPRERFVHWIEQDHHYLLDFARAMAWASARAPSAESRAWFAGGVKLTLETELALHRRLAAEHGADPARAPVWPTTRAYADFLVRAAATGTWAETLAALLPCEWGYVHLARQLARHPVAATSPYRAWIEQYTGAAFEDATSWLRAELDRQPVTVDEMVAVFVQSSRYELAFWEQCWRGPGEAT